MKLRILGMMITAVTVALTLSIPVFAAGEKYTFSHGINRTAKTTFGSTVSSKCEESMEIVMLVKDSSTGIIKCYTSEERENAIYIKLTKGVDGVKGSSYCYYYVNGAMKHQSTAWFNFDFK